MRELEDSFSIVLGSYNKNLFYIVSDRNLISA